MKQCLVIVVLLALIANSHCGFLDSVLGTVTDTASSITHKVGGVLHHGKTMVFGGQEQNAAGDVVNKPGIVGTISLKIHGVSEAVREEVRAVIHVFDGDQVHEKGIIGRFFDRVKCRVFKMKRFLLGNHEHIGHTASDHISYAPIKKLNNDTSPLRHKLGHYFFNNDAPAASGIRQTLTSLQEAITRARLNIAKKRQEADNPDYANNENDGSGLIDIRTSVNSLGEQNDFEHGVDAAYDKVNDALDEGRQTGQSYFNRAQQHTNNFIENQRRNGQNYYNQLGENVNRFRSDVGTTINNNFETQTRNVQNQYTQMANNGVGLRSDLGSAINDNFVNQRRNVQSHYNQMATNADRLITGTGSSINDNLENQRRNIQNQYNQMANNGDRFRSDLGNAINDNLENQRRNIQSQYNQMATNADRFKIRTNVDNPYNDNIENQRRNAQNHYNQMATSADRLRTDAGSYINDNLENQRRNVQSQYNQMATNAGRFRTDVDNSINNNIENQERNAQDHFS